MNALDGMRILPVRGWPTIERNGLMQLRHFRSERPQCRLLLNEERNRMQYRDCKDSEMADHRSARQPAWMRSMLVGCMVGGILLYGEGEPPQPGVPEGSQFQHVLTAATTGSPIAPPSMDSWGW